MENMQNEVNGRPLSVTTIAINAYCNSAEMKNGGEKDEGRQSYGSGKNRQELSLNCILHVTHCG